MSLRRSIFEIVSKKVDAAGDIKRIITIFENEETIFNINYYTIKQYVQKYSFLNWKHRNHAINLDDYLTMVGYTNLKKTAYTNEESMLTLIELIYNFWYLVLQDIAIVKNKIKPFGNYYHIKDIMDDLLAQYNYVAYLDKIENRILIIEDKSEVTSAAEILPSALAIDVIKYNHRSLKGEINLKKNILTSLGAELEPKRKSLQVYNKQLSEDIFFLLNNINIRHNNCDKDNKSYYKEFVSKMNKSELEKWYDELYQMILLAFLLLDNIERTKKIKNLKCKIAEGENNGQAENADSK